MKNEYEIIEKKVGTPTFIYSEYILKNNIKRIKDAILDTHLNNKINIYIAYFVNSNPNLFKILIKERIGLTLQSIEEWYQLDKFGISKTPIVVSPTSLSLDDLNFFFVGKFISLDYNFGSGFIFTLISP